MLKLREIRKYLYNLISRTMSLINLYSSKFIKVKNPFLLLVSIVLAIAVWWWVKNNGDL